MLVKIMDMKMHMRLSCKLPMKSAWSHSLYFEKADFKNFQVRWNSMKYNWKRASEWVKNDGKLSKRNS